MTQRNRSPLKSLLITVLECQLYCVVLSVLMTWPGLWVGAWVVTDGNTQAVCQNILLTSKYALIHDGIYQNFVF